jgi:hypothetical protein
MFLQIDGNDIDAMPIASSFVSDWISLGQAGTGNVFFTTYSINLAWTGTGAGSFQIEASNTKADAMAYAIPGASIAIADGSPAMFTFMSAPYAFARLRFAATGVPALILTAIAVRK